MIAASFTKLLDDKDPVPLQTKLNDLFVQAIALTPTKIKSNVDKMTVNVALIKEQYTPEKRTAFMEKAKAILREIRDEFMKFDFS
jgi:hypothetical protein